MFSSLPMFAFRKQEYTWRHELTEEPLCVRALTHLQLADGFHQWPVRTVATVRFLQQTVQNLKTGTYCEISAVLILYCFLN